MADAAGSVEVYLDGGVRRGTDVLNCLALGARAVFVGRSQLYGLTVGGTQGVIDVIEILRTELDRAMAFCGVAEARSVNRSLIARTDSSLPLSLVDQLDRLARLYEAGLLTRTEFDHVKATLVPA